jgi:hypothetical protein
MVNGYLHRLEALEERLRFRECPEGLLCYRCEMAKLHAELHGVDWGGCDGRPSRFIDRSRKPTEYELSLAIADLTEAELEQAAADLRILIARQEEAASADTVASGEE